MQATGVRRRVARWWPYVVVVAVALLASALHMARYTELSPFDESRHVDYMARIYEDAHVVRLGDKLHDTAMRLEACRGVDVDNFEPPPCDTKAFAPADFRDEGFNNAVNNPPLYYLVTGAFAETVKGAGISGSILDPARIMSGIWLAAGLVLAVYAGRLLGASDVPLVAFAVIFALAPEPLFMASTVNADSASVFGGALVLVAALLWERGRLHVGWLLAVGALVASLKMTNLIGVAIVGLYLLARAFWAYRERAPRAPTPRAYVSGALMLVAGALGVTVIWLGLAGARATIDALDLPSNRQFYEPGVPWKMLALRQNVFSLFPPLDRMRAPALITRMVDNVSTVAMFLAIGALVAASLRYSVRDRFATLGTWAAVVLVISGPGFIASTWLVNRVIFQPAARYGLSALAALIVVGAAMVKGRVATIALSTFAGIMAVTVLGTLAFG
jgi:hypothetical protein